MLDAATSGPRFSLPTLLSRSAYGLTPRVCALMSLSTLHSDGASCADVVGGLEGFQVMLVGVHDDLLAFARLRVGLVGNEAFAIRAG